MKTLVIAVYGNRMCRAFADAVAAHGEVAPGRVDATVLAEKISRPFVVLRMTMVSRPTRREKVRPQCLDHCT